ncbi:MAG: glycosyl transferase family protein [uncultured bacterium]|nr:MAG: glycosyl transferase family protein [uncultured bacterium]
MKQPYLSVIIPAYNELDNFRRGALDKVWEYLEGRSYLWEVIIVDDGSTDGSVKQISKFCQEKKGFKLMENPHMGKAGTVATGVKAAQGKYILFTDFDQATPLSEFEKLRPYLENGYEVAIGSREVAGARREDEPFYRHLMGRGFNFGVRLLTVRGIADTQCGFKAFEGKVAKELFSKLQVYKPTRERAAFVGAFDVELLFIARKLGYRIAEVPVHWQHVATTRINPVKDSIRMALDVIKIRLYFFLGRYGK